jgi:hypothetical protein
MLTANEFWLYYLPSSQREVGMSAKKSRVKLSKEQREKLEELTRRGTISVRKHKRARVLLLADENSQQGRKEAV